MGLEQVSTSVSSNIPTNPGVSGMEIDPSPSGKRFEIKKVFFGGS